MEAFFVLFKNKSIIFVQKFGHSDIICIFTYQINDTTMTNEEYLKMLLTPTAKEKELVDNYKEKLEQYALASKGKIAIRTSNIKIEHTIETIIIPGYGPDQD